MDYIVLDYATEKITAYCETLEEAEAEQEAYIQKRKSQGKCYDMYIYSMVA